MKVQNGYNIHVEAPKKLETQDAIDNAQVEFGNASFISAILHRHAQNLVIKVTMLFTNKSPYYKHGTKKTIVLLRKKLLEISIEEHIASQNEESDEYYDDRASDLTELTKNSDGNLFSTLSSHFSSLGYADASILARITATIFEIKIIGICIDQYMKNQSALSYAERRKFSKYWTGSLNDVFKLLIVLFDDIKGHMKHDVDCDIDFGNCVCSDINVHGIPEMKDCLNLFMDEMMDEKIWKTMAKREHEQLGADACMFESEFKQDEQ